MSPFDSLPLKPFEMPQGTVSRRSLESLRTKLVLRGECWEFTGAKDPNGYGRMKIGGDSGGTVLVHRLMYVLHFGPTTQHLLHTCDNPSCCNPAHLRPGTQADNLLDMRQKGRGGSTRKMSEEVLAQMRTMRLCGMKMADIADMYNVSIGTVSNYLKYGTYPANPTIPNQPKLSENPSG